MSSGPVDTEFVDPVGECLVVLEAQYLCGSGDTNSLGEASSQLNSSPLDVVPRDFVQNVV